MLQNRIIPALQIMDGKLVKTTYFKNPKYIGNPINAIKIFNEKEVDELLVLDISDNRMQRGPNYQMIGQMADECFMPLCYGGGISTTEQIRNILKIGVEKVCVNSAVGLSKKLISQAAELFGSQCVVVSIDVKKNWLGTYKAYYQSGKVAGAKELLNELIDICEAGAGEIIIHNIDKEGSWAGFDIELLRSITSKISIPCIAMGGAGNLQHIRDAISIGKVSAVAVGSMSVFQNKGMGVLINFPKTNQLAEINNL